MRRGAALFGILIALFITLTAVGNAVLHYKVASDTRVVYTDYNLRISMEILEPENRIGTVVLIHGVLATKNMLKPMATDLVRYGWRVILIDQLGHGGTEGHYSFSDKDLEVSGLALAKVINQSENFRKAVYSYLRKNIKNGEPLVFGGHSLGAFLAILMAIEQDNNFNITATIAIAPPFYEALANDTLPRNLLVCVGKHDEFIDPESLKGYIIPMLPEAVEPNKVFGNFTEGTARMLFISPNSDHILEPYDSAIISQIINWLELSLGRPPTQPIIISTFAVITLLVSALIGIVAVAILPVILAPLFGMISGGKRFPTTEQLKLVLKVTWAVWPMTTMVLLAILLVSLVSIAGELGQVMPVLVSGYLLIATLALLFSAQVLIKGTARDTILRVYLHMKSDFARGLILGLIEGFLFLFVLQVTLANIIFDFIPLTLDRWLWVFPSALAIFAYFMFHEYLYRAQVQEILGGRRKPAIFYSMGISAGSKVLVMLFIAIIISYVSPFSVVAVLSLLGMVFITMLTEGLAATSYYSTREILPHSIASAILWAFIVTSIFPTVYLTFTF